MKKVTLLVASVLCALGSYAQSSIEQLPTEIGKTTYQIVSPRGTLYYDKTIEESYLTSNCMTGRNQNDVISLNDERGQFLVIPAENNNAFYLYSVEAKKFVNHTGVRAGLTDEPTEIAMWAHGQDATGSQAYNHSQFSYTEYPFTIADNYVEGVRLQDNPHLNSINVCCWDGQNPDYRWCDTSKLDDGNVFKFVVAGEVSQETYNEVREALGLGAEVVVPVDPEPPVVVDPVEYGPVLLSTSDKVVSYKIHNLGADEGTQYKGNDCYVKYVEEKAGNWNSLWHTDAAEDADNFAFFAAEDGGVYIKDVTANKFVTWKENAEGGINWGSKQLTACQVTLVDAMAEAKNWFIVDDENTEGRYDIVPLEGANNGWSFMGGIDQDFVVLNLEKKTDRNIKWVFEQVEEEVTPVDPEPPVVEGPQAAFTLTNLSSTATDYSLPIEVPAEYAAPVLAAKATTTVIEFTKTAGGKAAFVASTDGGNNFYSNITLADNRIGFDYMMDNGQEGWFTKTKSPYTDLNTTVRVAFTQNEETGLLNWYDAETGELINSTNVSTNAAWGTRSFGTNGYNHLYVGGYRDAAGAAKYVFPGEIASVRVYAQELTTDELTSLSWEGLEDSFEFIPDFDYAAAVAPVLAEANAALEGHDNVWVTTVSDKLITRNNQFSSNNSDPQEGSLNNLLDGNAGTFWHSNWHQGNNRPMHSDYLQIELDEAIDGDVLLTFVRRAGAANDQVTLLDVETSMDGQNFAHAAYIDMPNSGAGKTEQKVFALEEKAKFLRFWADATTNNRAYWHCGDFQLQTVSTNLNIDAPDYAYPTAVAALQEAIATTPAVDGTKEDVEALAAAVEAYKAALAGYPEFTEWTGDVQVNAGNVATIDDLLNVDFCFNRALSTEASAYGVLGVVFDHTGDAYALAFDALFGGVEVEKVKADGFVGNVAHVQFEKIADLAAGLQDKAKGIAAKIGGFETAEGHAVVVLAGKSFLVDGEKYNAIVKADYELATGTVTAIENLIMNAKGEIFDLQGRRVNNAQNGLFIQNGKKVIR